MELVADTLDDGQLAHSAYYSRLADHFAQEIGSKNIRKILEAGCGKGQLTIPLLKKLPRSVRVIAVDSSRGPYSGWLDELPHKLREARLEHRVQIMEANVSRMADLKPSCVDAVISNELLCDLVPPVRLIRALEEFRRILRERGVMVHGEWSSEVENEPRSLLVKHRPSWSPDQLHSIMLRCGFTDFRVSYFEWTIGFKDVAALEELRSWGASSRFLRENEKLVKKEGFRLPFEHVVRCRKGRGS